MLSWLELNEGHRDLPPSVSSLSPSPRSPFLIFVCVSA